MIDKQYERLGITNVKWTLTTRWIINAIENDWWNDKYLTIKSTKLKSKCYIEKRHGRILFSLFIKFKRDEDVKKLKVAESNSGCKRGDRGGLQIR